VAEKRRERKGGSHLVTNMAYYPIAVDIADKPALVVGGGQVALRKVETLLEFGARVTVVSPESVSEICELADAGNITLVRRGYQPGDIDGAVLVIAATDDRTVNSRVSEDCRNAGKLVNVVDDPELCSFIVQSVVKRGDLTISIGTGGGSPALSRRIRETIEEIFGPEYARLTELMGEMREIAKQTIASQPQREAAFKRILDSDVLELLRQGRSDDARMRAMSILRGS
jgi:precorrin-2 dehydrogenase / sirohydrochlorin ferrochelatase